MNNETVFSAEINLNEIRLKKTSECFVQWRNRKSKSHAWGLNFVSEEEAQKFLDFCSPGRVRSTSTTSSSNLSLTNQPKSGGQTKLQSRKDSQGSSDTPTIQINDTDLKNKSPINGTLCNNIGDHYQSSSTLVATETHTPISSRTSTPIPRLQSNGDPDSGFGMEDVGSDSLDSRNMTHISPSHENHLSSRLSVASDSDYSVSSRSNLSDVDDLEMSYFKTVADLNANDRPVDICASFHDEGDLNSSCGTDLKPQSGIAQSRQGGATRKAGWLSVKHVLVRVKTSKVEQASDRKWRKCWVSLKSGALNFYFCNEKTVSPQDLDEPNFSLEIDGCVAQAVPEHAKLDHVFSVSSRLGEGYFFQASNQTDLENWITAIHSMAASVLAGAGQKGKHEMLRILTTEISRVEKKISSDSKLKKMAELQSTVVTDSKNKQAFLDQISKWDKNLEQLNIDFYRLQCYTAAIQGSQLPNPQTLLACVSRNTKQILSRLNIFSVMSFHAVVSARDPSTDAEVKTRNKAKRSASSVGKLKSALLTSLRINDAASVKSIRDRYSGKGSGTPRLKRQLQPNLDSIDDMPEEEGALVESSSLSSSHSDWKNLGNFLRISLDNNQSTVIPLHNEMTILEVVENTCSKRQLNPEAYYLKLGLEDDSGVTDYTIPLQDSLLESHNYNCLRLCEKCTFTIELERSMEIDRLDFGISVESKDEGIVVSSVEEGRLAHVQGVRAGDEILAVNDIKVEEVENAVEDLREALKDPSITLLLRSCRDEPPVANKVTSDAIITSLVVQPPPKISDTIPEQDLSDLIVPPPQSFDEDSAVDTESVITSYTEDLSSPSSIPSGKSVDELLQRAEQVTLFCRRQVEYSDDEEPKPSVRLSQAQKLRKVIIELVDTERSYVKDLRLLLKRYLDPMKDENFMSQSEVQALVSTVHDILEFQVKFLKEIERPVETETGFEEFSAVEQFQNVIYTIGETFFNYTEHFKLYSAFCSSHSRVVELLQSGSNTALHEFLHARNPKNQHSGTLESYLIKPIQRVVRYPLLLRTILKLLDSSSEEYNCLLEAVTAIEKVAEHINEMQRITEQFSPVFHQLIEEFGVFELADVSIDRLTHYGKVRWLNCPDDLLKSGTLKKYPVSPRIGKKMTPGTMHLFAFEKVLILLYLERKQKKKEKDRPTSLRSSDEIKFKTIIPASSLVVRDHCWLNDGPEPIHSWELVNISDTAEIGRQECAYVFANKTAEEKREMVKCIKEAIKRSIKAGYNLANAIAPRSPSFRRNNADDKLNASDPGPFLRLTSDQSSLFRRSFSHNPESFRNRRTSLESDATHSSDGSGETESISSATTRDRKYSLKKKNKVVSPLGLEDVQINL
ncbi:T-lymphoma invasion and metastasis-inducing protein 1-like isoform X1 [Pocillopora damicornis]|uniref:T-lymphoma invasion and metastasis-inducing protein 1-like isoform X1 n=1 Tax=Pocillopora damicornis TaxID=46731 RepID=UPI000F550096|nr:T-lymphoma invasion and metastasis-inducing protein 1-like isoform X1 [Pocillopora damicornis]XP_027051519.1 T-lymphoma invasion and metastasis-inducing protein 1-like isoform X1 [Pocillopora damicornis]